MHKNLLADISCDVGQIKRFERATSGKAGEMFFPENTFAAEFLGSSGLYRTTLDDCTCIDFMRCGEPCKHMYKLAIESGVIDPDVEPWKLYQNYSKVADRVKRKIATLTLAQLEELERCIDTIENAQGGDT